MGREEGEKPWFHSGVSFPGNLVKGRFEKSEPRTADSDVHKQIEGGEGVQGGGQPFAFRCFRSLSTFKLESSVVSFRADLIKPSIAFGIPSSFESPRGCEGHPLKTSE